ncbi:MAG TPA: ATP-binding protein [Chloroflexota bacterium]|nr:ATP-binding protein [Chloroflexota bacterium]
MESLWGPWRRKAPGLAILARRSRLSLAEQYLVASLLILVVTMVVLGLWVGEQIETGVLNRTGMLTALYVDSLVSPHLQSLATQPTISADDLAALNTLLSDTPLGQHIVAFRIWSLDGEVLYSPNPSLIGRRFTIDGGRARAARGEFSAEISNMGDPASALDHPTGNRMLEVYVPVRDHNTGREIAVAQFYQPPDDLDREIASARLRSWGVVIAMTFLTYFCLAGVVKRGSDTIERQRSDLSAKVAELTKLLAQNARLQDRLHQAAGRATAINEQALRRIGADLHDGPGQSLALALLRLDGAQDQVGASEDGVENASRDFPIVKTAVAGALQEIRAIAAGLRLPELAPVPVATVVERVLRTHERLTGTKVRLEMKSLPDDAPLPIKIALYRSLQEALSNATRHASGAEVLATVWADRESLYLMVVDHGPGFDVERVGADGRLGLANMREQAELLGGQFRIESRLGQGTTLQVSWPLGST